MYNTILFDIDGVLLSEERYFDASALTVNELLVSRRFLGIQSNVLPPYTYQPDEETIASIRKTVFVDDNALEFMKKRGINANWDMVYLQFATQFLRLIEGASKQFPELRHEYGAIHTWTETLLQEIGPKLEKTGTPIDFASFLVEFQDCSDKQSLFAGLESWYRRVFPGVVNAEATLRSLWDIGQQAFQEWYLGKEFLPQQPEDKAGFVRNEIPLAPPNEVSRLFVDCLHRGIRIGIATGRPGIETRVPFESLGWLQFFQDERITTASDVLEAEQDHPEYRPLSKPNPFCYLRSFYDSPASVEVLNCKRPLPAEVADKLLIVGDSVADLLAAKSIGCHFAAVLTGLSGEAARAQFEELQSDYILPNITELWSILEGNTARRF